MSSGESNASFSCGLIGGLIWGIGMQSIGSSLRHVSLALKILRNDKLMIVVMSDSATLLFHMMRVT